MVTVRPSHSGCWWVVLWYPVPTVLGLFRDCFRQGTGNSVVETPSSPCQEERGDHVMSPGPTERSRSWASEQTKGGSLLPTPGLLFLKGQWHSPAETANRNQNLSLIKSICSSLRGSSPEHKLKKALGEICKQAGSGKKTYGTHLPSSTLGSCPLLNPQRGSWGGVLSPDHHLPLPPPLLSQFLRLLFKCLIPFSHPNPGGMSPQPPPGPERRGWVI